MHSPDVVIAGAGLIGLACALQCERRGLRTVVIERGRAMQQASWAAAGMLAAHDPANPSALSALAQNSIDLYPAFLDHINSLSGTTLLFETEWALEQNHSAQDEAILPAVHNAGFGLIRERSIDPRKVCAAVLSAVQSAGVSLLENSPAQCVREPAGSGVLVQTAKDTIPCGSFLDCTGAWSAYPVRPAKGQMLRVHAPGLLHSAAHGDVVVRTDDIYLVPRRDGSVVIGATVEDAGFDRTVHEADLEELMQRAIALVPSLADAPRTETWAGLRPDTPDHLPLLGQVSEHRFIATGHFRNGILLAPATAQNMTQMLMGEQPEISLSAFAPGRFGERGAGTF